MIKKTMFFFFISLLVVSAAQAERQRFVEFTSYHVDIDVSKIKLGDDVWNRIKPYRQPLMRQFLEVPRPAEIGVKEVFVQSINDGRYIAFRLVWKDATKNDTIKIMNFSDGAAIQFPISKEASPNFFMGEKDKPVHILYWRAWRSKDKQDGFQNVKTAYPNMTSDIYTFDYKIKGVGTEKTQAEKDIFIAGRAAKNPLSFPRKEIIAELSAVGWGTLTPKNVENTWGRANWENGQWALLFRRPLIVNDSESVKFKAGERMPIAFAIWEGSRRETGGRKAVSPAWAEVEVEK